MARFQPGQSGNPAGMRRGTKHRATPEIRAVARRLFDRDYWQLKYRQLHDGTAHPKIEALLLAYAYGMPRSEVVETGSMVVVQTGLTEALDHQPDPDTPLLPEAKLKQ